MLLFGYPRVLKIDKIVFGYGASLHNMFEIRQEDNEGFSRARCILLLMHQV